MRKRFCDKCGQEIGYKNFPQNEFHIYVGATDQISQDTPGNLTFDAELCAMCAQAALYEIREVLGREKENR